MAAIATVSGLASGLDTSSIIASLMKVEAASQTRLKGQLTTEQSTLKSLQDLNSKIAALATQAGALAKATTWSAVKVTSSSDKVDAVAGPGAAAGSVSFTVGRLAAAHQLTFTGTASPATVVTTGSTQVRLDFLDGTTRDVETGDGTLNGLVNALNASGTGVRATTVTLDDGTQRLRVTSATTGAASDFTLRNLDGSDLLGGASVAAGQDAEITVGSDVVHSTTNTFTAVVSGLDITLRAGLLPGTVVDLTATVDTTGLKSSVKSLVDNLNAALASVDSLTSYNSSTKSSGALAGDAVVRALRNALLEAVHPGDGTSMADVGIQVDRYGKVTFDEAAFDKAYAGDPAMVRDRFTTAATAGRVDGFAARLQAVAKQASDPTSGTLTSSVTSRNDTIRRLQDSISDWDDRLALRQQTLTRQFTALETALSQLQSQGNWLAGQLASLPSGS